MWQVCIENWVTSLGKLMSLERLELVKIEEPLNCRFHRLTGLQYLMILNCKVTSIPASFKKLMSLQVLEVGRIISRQVIPIRSFRQLLSLKMTCWVIADLVDVFREWIALEELALHWTKVNVRKSPLSPLSNSLEIWVEGHDAVPNVLWHLQWYLTKVKDFKLQCEHGATAVMVRNLINLVTLEITVTCQQAVPDIFGKLQKLWRLKLSCSAVENNLVESFAESLGNLYSLQELEVKNCPIESLPESLGQLSSLRRLKVSWCRNLKTLPDSIGDLSSLESLDLSGSDLHSLPDTNKNLSQLKNLNRRPAV
ncbi:hypothetical protein R1flu_017089 [Riccia fluitans]|uniref:Disease resistance R13L4/SHOC-2-like LRR domain-containing protein n=1 Tax=Riccia fluitans TaxID=41844 RepID=A0ABD1YNP3_9MARC